MFQVVYGYTTMNFMKSLYPYSNRLAGGTNRAHGVAAA
jgi:hypothetical protein